MKARHQLKVKYEGPGWLGQVQMESEKAPRQCPKCGSRRWNEGEAEQVDRYLRTLTIRHLNPYRKPKSFRQKAAILRRRKSGVIPVAVKKLVAVPPGA